ncbi:Cys-tRNA(Pro) deacylase [Microbulbifer epialgicus]|uniref:Cys-tRNA(Pro)/Cys-tRNA(Cys) deacylase n=1 Tax=Microbulbifer epialgicus TaxID=393907 RepID=A0ABV4P3Z1_9GAMM
MTPAIIVARKNKIDYRVHEYKFEASAELYGLEAAEKLGQSARRVFKTLVVVLDNKEFSVGVIPVSSMLSMKRIAVATGVKRAFMATKADVKRSTGYILGGVSPLGQKKPLKTFIDSSVMNFDTIYISAGRRGLELEINPNDLITLTNGVCVELCQ